MCGFNTTVPHRITVMKCVSGWSEILLDARMVAVVELSGLALTLA
jgi:hypothetical protein